MTGPHAIPVSTVVLVVPTYSNDQAASVKSVPTLRDDGLCQHYQAKAAVCVNNVLHHGGLPHSGGGLLALRGARQSQRIYHPPIYLWRAGCERPGASRTFFLRAMISLMQPAIVTNAALSPACSSIAPIPPSRLSVSSSSSCKSQSVTRARLEFFKSVTHICSGRLHQGRANRPPPSNRPAAPREQRCPQPRPGYTQGGGGSTRTCFQNLTISWPPRTSPMPGTASAAAVSLSSHSELSPPWKKMSAYHSSNTQYLS